MAKQEAQGSQFVYAVRDTVLHDKDGLPFRTFAGQPWWAEDPLVKHHPVEFSTVPQPETVGRSSAEQPPQYVAPPNVERATRAPGEVRV